jgi:hypothetical protein
MQLALRQHCCAQYINLLYINYLAETVNLSTAFGIQFTLHLVARDQDQMDLHWPAGEDIRKEYNQEAVR